MGLYNGRGSFMAGAMQAVRSVQKELSRELRKAKNSFRLGGVKICTTQMITMVSFTPKPLCLSSSGVGLKRSLGCGEVLVALCQADVGLGSPCGTGVVAKGCTENQP